MDIGAIRREARAILLDSDAEHRFAESGTLHAVLLIDPETGLARHLIRRYLAEESAAELLANLIADGARELCSLFEREAGIEDAQVVSTRFLNSLAGSLPAAHPVDPRIAKALEIVRSLPEKRICLDLVAREVRLSEGRFGHLFSREIGIPFRRYLLWRRLNGAVGQILRGVDFTRAAYDAGFSDSAHLSRTFHRMFGTTLIEYFKNLQVSRFVQADSDLLR
jgi:AraC family transcriptional regulator